MDLAYVNPSKSSTLFNPRSLNNKTRSSNHSRSTTKRLILNVELDFGVAERCYEFAPQLPILGDFRAFKVTQNGKLGGF